MNASAPIRGLLDLDNVPLDLAVESGLAASYATCGGSEPWKQRKRRELRALSQLAALSKRFQILRADLELEIRVLLAMRTPVPCTPDASGRLRIAPLALLGLRYPEAAVRLPQPGSAFVQILEPREVFHSNVSAGSQVLCLGAHLGPGLRVHEIAMLVYGALSLQTVALDVLDPAGVLNPGAAEYFQQHPQVVPLTREPFLIDN
jgi:hypothetical protein